MILEEIVLLFMLLTFCTEICSSGVRMQVRICCYFNSYCLSSLSGCVYNVCKRLGCDTVMMLSSVRLLF